MICVKTVVRAFVYGRTRLFPAHFDPKVSNKINQSSSQLPPLRTCQGPKIVIFRYTDNKNDVFQGGPGGSDLDAFGANWLICSVLLA